MRGSTFLMGATRMAAFIDKEYSVQMREMDRAYMAAVAALHPEKVIESARAKLLPEPMIEEPVEITTMRQAAQVICKRYGITEIDLVGPRRTRLFNEPRSEFVGLCKTVLDKSYNQIGAYMSGRNHTSILHYFNMYREAHPEHAMLEAA
jgi:chromosomal replication initiation ATPase DnaA